MAPWETRIPVPSMQGLILFNATGGTWTVYVWRDTGGTTGGNYALQVIVGPGNIAVSGGYP